MLIKSHGYNMVINLADYFNRIDYKGSQQCNSQTLIEIHRQQCFHIPFDMLDPHLRISPSVEPRFIFQKILQGKRGGGCTQINELLALTLIELGFKVSRLMARVLYDVPKDKTPILAHKALLVEFGNEKWLCDTGFGSNGLIDPIPFELNIAFKQFDTAFMLVKDDVFGYKLQTQVKGEWVDLYAFHLLAFFPEDFNAMHYYNCRNPDRIYVRHAIVTMPFLEGRKILVDRTYKERTVNGTNTIEIKDIRQYHDILKSEFNIELPMHPLFFPRQIKVV